MPDPNEKVENSETPQNTPAPEATTPQQETVETQPQTQEEDFLEGSEFDSRTLPPQLQAAYKGMQGAFTKKMQSQSEKYKDYETIKGEHSQYVTLFGDPVISERLAALRTGQVGTPAAAGQVQEPRYMTEQQMLAYFGAKDAYADFVKTYGDVYLKRKAEIDNLAAKLQASAFSPAERLNFIAKALDLKPASEANATNASEKKPDTSAKKGPDRGKGGSVPQPKASTKGMTKEEKFQAAADATKAEMGITS
jgi:hypothetical protein